MDQPKELTVTKVVQGPSPHDTKVYLSDGSELVGLTTAQVKSDLKDVTRFEMTGVVKGNVDAPAAQG
jgi:hypothetical protein